MSNSNNVDEALDSLRNTTTFMQKTKGVSALLFYVKYVLLSILAYRLSHGFLMGVLCFIGFSVGFFIVVLVIVQASRLLFINRDPIQREAYLMNFAVGVPLVMTVCLFVYVITSWW